MVLPKNYLKVFTESDTVFTTDGDRIIYPLSGTITEELNGDYYLECDILNEEINGVETGHILAVYYKDSWQGFRVRIKDIDNEYTKIKAYHVSFDAQDVLIKGTHEFKGTSVTSLFGQITALYSDPTSITVAVSQDKTVDVILNWASLADLLGELSENYSYIIQRDNFNITLVNSTDAIFDNGVTIERGKLLDAVNKSEDINDIVTKLYPTVEVNKTVYTIDQEYVEDNTLYAHKYVQHVEFTPMYPDYYNSIISVINDSTKEKQDLESDIASLNSKNESLQEKITELDGEIAQHDTMLTEMKTVYMQKMNTNEEFRNNVKSTLTKRINVVIQDLNKKKSDYNKEIEKLNNWIATEREKWNTHNEEYFYWSRQDTKGAPGACRFHKEQMGYAEKNIKKYETQIKEYQKLITDADKRIKKYEEYYDEVTNHLSDFTQHDLETLMELLQEDGITFTVLLAEDYKEHLQLEDEIEDLKKDIEDTFKDILNLKNKKTELENQIATNTTLISEYTNKVTELTAIIEERTAFLAQEVKADLLEQAQNYLDIFKYPQVSYTIDVIDAPVTVGEKVQVKNSLLGIDILTDTTQTVFNVNTQMLDTITFGNTDASLKAYYESLIKKATDTALAESKLLMEHGYSNMMEKIDGIEGYVTGMLTEKVEDGQLVDVQTELAIHQYDISLKCSESTATSIAQAQVTIEADKIRNEVSETYTPLDKTEELELRIGTEIEQTNESVTIAIEQSKAYTDDAVAGANEAIETMGTYFTFDDNGFSIGKSDSEIKTLFSNDRISFMQGDTEVAYISDQTLHIPGRADAG